MGFIQRPGLPVYPAEAKRLFDRVVVRHALLSRIDRGKYKPDLAVRLEMFGEPGPPLRAVLAENDGFIWI